MFDRAKEGVAGIASCLGSDSAEDSAFLVLSSKTLFGVLITEALSWCLVHTHDDVGDLSPRHRSDVKVAGQEAPESEVEVLGASSRHHNTHDIYLAQHNSQVQATTT